MILLKNAYWLKYLNLAFFGDFSSISKAIVRRQRVNTNDLKGVDSRQADQTGCKSYSRMTVSTYACVWEASYNWSQKRNTSSSSTNQIRHAFFFFSTNQDWIKPIVTWLTGVFPRFAPAAGQFFSRIPTSGQLVHCVTNWILVCLCLLYNLARSGFHCYSL